MSCAVESFPVFLSATFSLPELRILPFLFRGACSFFFCGANISHAIALCYPFETLSTTLNFNDLAPPTPPSSSHTHTHICWRPIKSNSAKRKKENTTAFFFLIFRLFYLASSSNYRFLFCFLLCGECYTRSSRAPPCEAADAYWEDAWH
jgi:hypothetical protein